jgi:hypothetical protein
MDPSRGAEKTGATLPTPCVEPVKLPTGRELEIKFNTDSAGLKLALRSELLSTDAPDTEANAAVRLFRHACRRSTQAANVSSGAKGAEHAYYGPQGCETARGGAVFAQ